MRVGIAGLGKMGSIFADRIKAAEHDLAVWNRTPEKAKAVAGATAAASPADLAVALRNRAHHRFRRRGRDGGLPGRWRAALGRHCGEALRRDEHGAACHACPDRQGSRGGGRALHRIPGRRLGEGGERGQAARLRRRRCVRPGPGAARAGSALPPHRPCRAGGRRGGAEARHQPAAFGLLAGARRGGVAHRRLWLRPELADRAVLRKLRRTERAEGARAATSPRRLPARTCRSRSMSRPCARTSG